MSGKNPEGLGWKPHPLKQGDGRGGWVVHPAEYQFLHPHTGRSICPFGVAQMDNGEIILLGAWHDGGEWREGRAEHPANAFSQDGGGSWTEFETLGEEVWGRPMMLTYLGNGELSFQASHGRYFSGDYGRTWLERVPVPPAWRWQVEYEGKTYTRSVSEGSLVRAANGWLVAALRTDMPPRYFDAPHDDSLEGLGVSISQDDGQTWSAVQVLYDAGRHHPHLLLLPNGNIAMTLIVRDDVQEGRLASYRRGCEAIISRDHGLSWDVARTYVLDDFEFCEGAKWYNGECGHLYSTLLGDGSILTCYGNYLTRGASLIRWRPA